MTAFDKPALPSYEERLYTGKVATQLSRIRADGLQPAPVAYVMLRHLERELGIDTSAESEMWEGYIDTGDVLLARPDGTLTYFHDFFARNSLKEACFLKNGKYFLRYEYPLAGEGVLFRRDELILDRDLTSEEVRAHPLWETAARYLIRIPAGVAPYDGRLLQAYHTAMCPSPETRMMGIFPGALPGEPRLLAAGVVGLGCRSQFDGGYDLGVGSWRLAVVAPEALAGAPERSREVCDFIYRCSSVPGVEARAGTESRQLAALQERRKLAPHDIMIAPDLDEKYVRGGELMQVLSKIEQGGKLSPEMRELILHETGIARKGEQKNE